jgi:hypothetical protein
MVYMFRKLSALAAASVGLLALSSPALASGPSLGYYQCYHTIQTTNALTNAPTGYITTFAGAFYLNAHHKYQTGITTGGGNIYGQSFAFKGHTLRFGKGAFNTDLSFWHVTGTYHARGVTMPHSVLNPSRKYKLVLHGRAGDSDSAPPAAGAEFKQYVASSFWYCSKR